MWELIFMLLILKVPMLYVCWVVWWAIKAEPEIGAEGDSHTFNWKPWQPQSGPRPRRGGPRGTPARSSRRSARSRAKASA
jgi:hypothetical protein